MKTLICLCFVPMLAFAGQGGHDEKPIAVSGSISGAAAQSESLSVSKAMAVSEVTTTTSAEGGAGGLAQQSLSSKTGDVSVSSVYRQKLQIPATASPTAPAIYASGGCAGGDSKAITTPIFGASKGKSTPDLGCERREWYRVLAPTYPALALKVACSDPVVAAVATLEECLASAPEAKLEVKPEPAQPDMSLYYTKPEVDERLQRQFKQGQSK